jgi:hypothetical protein
LGELVPPNSLKKRKRSAALIIKKHKALPQGHIPAPQGHIPAAWFFTALPRLFKRIWGAFLSALHGLTAHSANYGC